LAKLLTAKVQLKGEVEGRALVLRNTRHDGYSKVPYWYCVLPGITNANPYQMGTAYSIKETVIYPSTDTLAAARTCGIIFKPPKGAGKETHSLNKEMLHCLHEIEEWKQTTYLRGDKMKLFNMAVHFVVAHELRHKPVQPST
jgi:hypothetical protein